MIVYVDLMFLMNLILNAALLHLTGWTRKLRLSLLRVGAASALGALYVVIAFFPVTAFFYSFAAKAVFALIMNVVAFGFGSLQHFLRNLAVFYMINFSVAGGIFALYQWLQSSHGIWGDLLYTSSGGLVIGSQIAGWFIVVAFVALLGFYRVVTVSQARRVNLTSYLCEVEIRYEGETIQARGLIDTGNQLYDPLSRMPVIVMQAQLFAKLWSPEVCKVLSGHDLNAMTEVISLQAPALQTRLRIVPYRGVHADHQMMIAWRPDQLIVRDQGGECDTANVLIALSDKSLSPDGTYQAVIHPSLLKTQTGDAPAAVAVTSSAKMKEA